MTATGRDFSNPEGMYLDAVVVVVDDDDVVLASTFFLCLTLGVGFSALGFFFGPCAVSYIQKNFFTLFFFLVAYINSFKVLLEILKGSTELMSNTKKY